MPDIGSPGIPCKPARCCQAHTEQRCAICCQADEYARKGINLTPDVWLVKLMVGAIDPTCGSVPSTVAAVASLLCLHGLHSVGSGVLCSRRPGNAKKCMSAGCSCCAHAGLRSALSDALLCSCNAGLTSRTKDPGCTKFQQEKGLVAKRAEGRRMKLLRERVQQQQRCRTVRR